MEEAVQSLINFLIQNTVLKGAYFPFILILLIVGFILYKAHHSDKTSFCVFDMLVSSETGKAGLDKVGKLLGYLALTWWFIDMAARGEATPAEATVYGGLLVAAQAINKAIDVKGNQAGSVATK